MPTMSRFLLLLILAVAAGCGPSGPVRPLLDGHHAPDVLVEEQGLARPPATGGNRFLTGWMPGRRGGQVALAPVAAERARLEVVNLERRRRTLVIDFHEGAPAGTLVRVRAGGRDLGAFALTDPLEIPLPFDEIPLGRVAVDLAFESGAAVAAAAVRPVLPAGEVRVEGADLVQSGSSLVDLVRPVAGAEALVGAFVPPASPRAGQRFELIVEREDGSPADRFSWTPGPWDRVRGKRRIELPLSGAGRFVRVRLRAAGAGPAGRWEGLGLAGGEEVRPAASPGMTVEKSAAPPRLVVVYVMDALRADTVGHLGGKPGVSPVIDRLAREGVAFRAHRSVAPHTLPSTKALFTGRPFAARGGRKLTPEDGPTLAELFRRAGYRTGLFSGNVHVGPAFGTARGFEKAVVEKPFFPDFPFNDNAARVNAAALAWLRSLPAGSKTFLYLHTLHPHNPYDPPEPYRSRFTAGLPSTVDGSIRTLKDIQRKRMPAGPADRERLRGLYTGAFSYNDGELEGFLAALASWATPAETLVAVTSDHGEELFDHGGMLHGYTLYEEMVRIPLTLWAPGRLRPGEVTARTTTLDLHATLLDLAGIPGPAGAQGRPLASPLSPGPHLAATDGLYGIRSDRFKVIWAPRKALQWGMGEGIGRSRDPEYVFDLQRDPRETVNLAGSADLEAAWLRSRLLAWAEQGRAGEDVEPAPVDPETLERLRALGYAN
jgi:arylsulfatase A-like enzyme